MVSQSVSKHMGNLTLFELEILKILEIIEYHCEITELKGLDTKKEKEFLEILYTDKNRPALEEELTKMNSIERYLQKNGINFHLTHNFIDEPERADGLIMLGIIKDKKLKDIKFKVAKLIYELKRKEAIKKLVGDKMSTDKEIKQLELLEDKTRNKRITVFININYKSPIRPRGGKYWRNMYDLAVEQQIPYDKCVLDYFNSNENNPLYSNGEFNVTKILKKDNDYIIPNIIINCVTQKAVTQRLKSA